MYGCKHNFGAVGFKQIGIKNGFLQNRSIGDIINGGKGIERCFGFLGQSLNIRNCFFQGDLGVAIYYRLVVRGRHLGTVHEIRLETIVVEWVVACGNYYAGMGKATSNGVTELGRGARAVKNHGITAQVAPGGSGQAAKVT